MYVSTDLSSFVRSLMISSPSFLDGFACEGSTLRISLLRSPTSPDAECDQGHHSFSFALQPHRGSFNESNIPEIGMYFNNPLKLRRSTLPSALKKTPLIEIRGDRNIVLETIKRGEDDHYWTSIDATKKRGEEAKTVIARIYEQFGGHGRASVCPCVSLLV